MSRFASFLAPPEPARPLRAGADDVVPPSPIIGDGAPDDDFGALRFCEPGLARPDRRRPGNPHGERSASTMSLPGNPGPNKDVYKKFRLAGDSRAEAGRKAGFKWKSRAVATVCGLRLDRALGIPAPARRPSAARRGRAHKESVAPPAVQADKSLLSAETADAVRQVIADLTSRRARITTIIETLEDLLAQ